MKIINSNTGCKKEDIMSIPEKANTGVLCRFSSSYYTGVVEAYERELEKAEKAGVSFRFNRLDQFKMMLEDFKAMEAELKNSKI